jgi:TonB-linked SusC/RagA family outer membrane protein
MVSRNSGSPSGDVTIRIRGVATINGSADPLYVVDGVQVGTSIDFLNPNDVENIEILKDASATAIYGARGANGVIMITTKQGQRGRARITASANFTSQVLNGRMDVLDANEFTAAAREAVKNDGTQLTQLAWGEQYAGKLNTIDWQDVMTRTSLQQNYNVSAQGGSDNTQAALSIGYTKNEGIVVFSDYERLTGRASVRTSVKDFMTLGGSLNFMRSSSGGGNNIRVYAQAPPTMDQLEGNVAGGALVHVPIQYADGTWGHYFPEGNGDVNKGQDNMYAAAAISSKYRMSSSHNVMASGDIELKLLKGLTFKTIVSYRLGAYDGPSFTEQNPRIFDSSRANSFSINQNQTQNRELESYFSYHFEKNIHRLDLVAGYSASRYRRSWVSASASSFPANNLREVALTSDQGSRVGNGGIDIESRFVSYYGRAMYSLMDRYLLTGTVRRDGSSNFGAGNRWGIFASGSLAWRISEESFFKNNDWLNQNVSNLKLRLGWGQTGNSGGATNQAVPQLSSNEILMYFFDAQRKYVAGPGVAQLNIIDTNLKWETNEQTNIGLDFGFLNNSLNFTAEYYIRDARDILLWRQIRPSTGFSSIYTNAGHIRNQGFEFTANYNKRIGDWSFSGTLTATTLKNKAVDVGDPIMSSTGASDGDYWNNWSLTQNGYPVASYYGWEVEGIIQSQQEIDALNAIAVEKGYASYQEGSTKPGDFKYKDQPTIDTNNDGILEPDGTIDDNDRVVLGHGYPKLTYGLNLTASYKKWDFNINMYGVSGITILSYAKAKLTTMYGPDGGYQNVAREYVANAWSPSNTDAIYPLITKTNANHNNQVSSAFLENGDYLRISNIQVGYTFDKQLISKLKLDNLRITANIQNPLTISAYNKWGDPEIGDGTILRNGFDGGRYPMPISFSLGLNATF